MKRFKKTSKQQQEQKGKEWNVTSHQGEGKLRRLQVTTGQGSCCGLSAPGPQASTLLGVGASLAAKVLGSLNQ